MRQTVPLVLASASPRRRELLSNLDLEFSVWPADVEEPLPAAAPRAERVARQLARAKGRVVASRFPDAAVLAADTVVVLGGRLLGKPADTAEAWDMLRALRGRWHRVISAVVVGKGRQGRVAHTVTRVHMRGYTDDEIAGYVARGEPFDKAGAYAIQDAEFQPVAGYEGCYCNVVGLPWPLALQLLHRTGAALLDDDVVAPLPECLRCPLLATCPPAASTSR